MLMGRIVKCLQNINIYYHMKNARFRIEIKAISNQNWSKIDKNDEIPNFEWIKCDI